MLSPNLYTIELTHGNFTWTIKKRYKHIQHLHQQLKLFRMSLNIPFPTRIHRERRTSFKLEHQNSRLKRKFRGALPRFPSKPEALVSYENIDERMQQLERYLQNLLQINLYRNHHETISFLEVSEVSFVKDLAVTDKGKEGLIEKRTGSTQPGCNFCGLLDRFICVRCSYLLSDLCGKWRKRWLFVKDTYLGYMRPKDGFIKCVLLFDAGFDVSSGIYSTGLHHGIIISNQNRQLVVKCWTKRKRKEWLSYLKDIISRAPGRDFTQKNRHNSYAPMRTSVDAAWFVDGSSYMAAVADAMEAAKEEIFIADWWLSPEIYMKRPAMDDDYWRLDKILQRKAAQGVKIFVLLYKEVEVALGINSYYSKRRLIAQHPEEC
ncbi:hypothetical protein L9F63_000650 [Diploptera punctata]|uniref:PX domain-containing protein n=1 Tax=Diploptera punctata TaxID=6984 RepID=A0AAD8ETK4_DIPPU|nr:hypothetical protein L9F63_000650 [Diploptera punctata]